MKKTELYKIVREAIQEVINETTMSTIVNYKDKSRSDQVLDIDPSDTNTINKLKSDPNIVGLTVGPKKIKEDNIDEFANQPIRFELAPGVNAADFTGKKGRIIATMQDADGPIGKPELARAMGYVKIINGEEVPYQNPINTDFMSLVASGAIIRSGIQTAPRANLPQPAAPEVGDEDGEDVPSGYEDPEGGVAGDMSPEDVDAGFPKMGGSDEEEPEADEIETADVATGKMSDKDYEAFMQYTDLENRLASVKSNILKAKRSRPSMGDISDTPSNELQNLRDLKVRLQTKMDSLLAGNEYLQARKAKMTKKAEPEETETEPLDEWTKGRMQYYAGIKK